MRSPGSIRPGSSGSRRAPGDWRGRRSVAISGDDDVEHSVTGESVPEIFPLASEFPAASRDDWLKLVMAALKGAPFEKLTSRSYDNLRIEPLYGRDPTAASIPGRAPGAPWQVLARVDHPDPGAANAEARHELADGATGLSVVFAGGIASYGYGLEPASDALKRVFENIDASNLSIELDLAWRDGVARL